MQDPLAAIAAATSRRARQAATAAAAALTHHATAVAAAPCKLLVLSADDLRRFGRRVRAPLAEAAAVRRDWLQQRIAAVQVSLWNDFVGGGVVNVCGLGSEGGKRVAWGQTWEGKRGAAAVQVSMGGRHATIVQTR